MLPKAASAESAQQVKQPWQRAAAQRRLAFMLLTVLSTVIASVLFAGVQPDYDNVWLEYGQIGLYGLLSGWVVTGFVTALMGFYVSVRGDKHALSAKQVVNHPMNPEARTAIIMPICNEDVATVFAGLRATCESVAATGHAKQFDVFVLSDSYTPRPPPPSAPPGKTFAPPWPKARTSRRSRCTTACAPAARTARPATWPTSAAAGARTTATWSCSTPTP
jgi:membrane glycosyltransferase